MLPRVGLRVRNGLEATDAVSKNDEFCILKTRNCVSKTGNLRLKTLNFAGRRREGSGAADACCWAAGNTPADLADPTDWCQCPALVQSSYLND